MWRALLFLLITAGAYAQESTTYEFDTTVVMATREPRPLSEIPFSTTVLTAQNTWTLQPFDIAEVTRGRAGIDVLQYGGVGSVSTVSMRGIPSTGILLLKDGRPINSILTGAGDLSMIPYSQVTRIEIVRAPTSALYGANGLGGTVNLITERTGDRPSLDAEARFGDQKVDNLAAGLYFPWPRIDFQVGGSRTSSTGDRSNSDGLTDAVNSRLSLRSGPIRLSGGLSYVKHDLGLPGPLPPSDSVPVFGDSSAWSLFDHQQDEALLTDVKIRGPITDQLTAEAAFFMDRSNIDFHTQYLDFMGDTMVDDYRWLVNSGGAHAMLSLNREVVGLTLGFDARYDSLESELMSNQGGDTTWFAISRNHGAWADALLRISPAMTINQTNRFDRNLTYGTFWSNQLGLVCTPAVRICCRASAGHSFRAPTFNDLYYPGSGNPDLKPEDGIAAEVGAEYLLRNAGSASTAGLTGFYRHVSNKIAWQPGAQGNWHPVNVNSATTKGVEAIVVLVPLSFARLELDLTIQTSSQRNRELTYSDWLADSMAFTEIQRRAAYVPRSLAGVVLAFSLPYRTTATIRGRYSSDRVNYYEDYSSAPTVRMLEKRLSANSSIDVSLVKEIGKYLVFGVGTKNLLDESYSLQFGNTIRDRDYPMPGREIFATIRAKTK